MNFNIPALITALTLFLLFGVALNVGRARGKYRIEAPATTGHPKFELAYRVQMNTVESTIAFLPALWLFAWYVSSFWAGVLGALWLAGRVWYAFAYCDDASKRSGGFGLSTLAFATMASGSLVAIIMQMLAP